jgi:hypothetical protein
LGALCQRSVKTSRRDPGSFPAPGQTIAITGRSYRLKDHATIAGKEDKNKKAKIQAQRTFDRRTGELNGSLSGSARILPRC